MKCDCNDCTFRDATFCEHRKTEAEVAALRHEVARLKLLLAVNAQYLGDIAGTLYDHDLHNEEDEALYLIKLNRLAYTTKDKENTKW